MISSIQIRGYRGFSEFEMVGLERVNLLVGTNNSGKTSVLEAIYLLMSRGDPWSLWQVMSRRGERLNTPGDRPSRSPELDVSHLFTGHDAQLGSKFTLVAKNQTPERRVTFAVGEIKDQMGTPPASGQQTVPSRLGLHISGNPKPPVSQLPLSRSYGLIPDVLESPRRVRRRSPDDEETPAQFITTESLEGSELISLWDKVALTPNEDRVLLALRFLDPDIERIAAQAGAQQFWGGRGGFIVKLKGREHPLPIGSMGDGMWRMLAMAIAIAHCKGGVLLVDEIDTGLHYTVLEKMWKQIFGAAQELDVQVFATTHSSDCIKSLAELCVDREMGCSISLQRIESGREKSVPYTASEIEVAAEKQIEVR